MAALSERLERELDHPAALDDVAREVNEIAHRFECGAVAGASALGARIAEASVAVSMNGLRVFDAHDPAETVLVIEGVLASGVQVARMAESARRAGAKHTPAVAVLADPHALKWYRGSSVDKVIALREF